MFCAIGLDVAAVFEEVLQVGLQIDAKMRREVVLESNAQHCRPLAGYVEGFVFLKDILAVVDVANIGISVYRQFKHGPCRGVETEMRRAVPSPTEAERDAEIVDPLAFLNIGQAATSVEGGSEQRVAETCFERQMLGELSPLLTAVFCAAMSISERVSASLSL